MTEIRAELVGFAELLRLFEQAPLIVEREVDRALHESALYLQSKVQEKTEVGVTGHLRESITTAFHLGGDNPYAEVFIGSSAPYGICVEEGTRPHWMPWEPLELWVAKKIGGTPVMIGAITALIRFKIAMKGTEGQHMFQRTYEEEKDTLNRYFVAAVERVMKEIAS